MQFVQFCKNDFSKQTLFSHWVPSLYNQKCTHNVVILPFHTHKRQHWMPKQIYIIKLFSIHLSLNLLFKICELCLSSRTNLSGCSLACLLIKGGRAKHFINRQLFMNSKDVDVIFSFFCKRKIEKYFLKCVGL